MCSKDIAELPFEEADVNANGLVTSLNIVNSCVSVTRASGAKSQDWRPVYISIISAAHLLWPEGPCYRDPNYRYTS